MSEWKLRRGDSELPIQSSAELRSLAEAGKVAESDYIWNPTLEKWLYARDVAEIAHVFRQQPIAPAAPVATQAKNPHQTGCAAGIALALLGVAALFWGIPLIGGLLIVAGIIVAVVASLQK